MFIKIDGGYLHCRHYFMLNSQAVGRTKLPLSDILQAQSLWLSNNVLAERFPIEIRRP